MISHQSLWEATFPQFIAAKEPMLQALMDAASLVKVPAHQQLFYPGSQCEKYLLVVEGSVKTQLISDQGREMLLYHVHPGDSCVLTTSCLLSGDRYPAEGVTEAEVKAFALPAQAFYRGMEQSAFFREFVFKNFATRLSHVIQRIESIVFNPIDMRLSQLLLTLNTPIIHKTHQELAAELGSAREVVSRHLKRFETYGWIKITRGSIEIMNSAALYELSRSDKALK